MQEQAIGQYSRLYGKMKDLRSHFINFFITSNKIKNSYTFFCDILIPAAFWFACFFNSFDYMREQAIERTLPCLAKWKSYYRI